MINKNYQFCNNCGKRGHSFGQCRQPITSIGVIGFRYNTTDKQVEYLLICRKDSLGYVDFVRGKYNIHNKQHLMNIIDEMTNTEKENLISLTFDELWDGLWVNEYGLKYRNDEKISREKFQHLKLGIVTTNGTYTLEDLIRASGTNWTNPEWGFPKGRRNYMEKDISAGIREFEEETGIHRQNMDIIQNIVPYEEVFTGSNYKSYKHKYFIARIQSEESLENYQISEVSRLKWFSYEDANDIIRSYNLEKKDILNKINKMLQMHRLIV